MVYCLVLRHLTKLECKYNVFMVQQFYATVVFDGDVNTGMTWMSGTHKLTTNFQEFGALMGYPFIGSHLNQGARMRIVGVEYDKK